MMRTSGVKSPAHTIARCAASVSVWMVVSLSPSQPYHTSHTACATAPSLVCRSSGTHVPCLPYPLYHGAPAGRRDTLRRRSRAVRIWTSRCWLSYSYRCVRSSFIRNTTPSGMRGPFPSACRICRGEVVRYCISSVMRRYPPIPRCCLRVKLRVRQAVSPPGPWHGREW
ncbi:hypothetical protein KCP69_18350 [Salmonella enterica subsp. enterica]|nr:hypothetical protein KCP69_18350 [Salmonella enterica subsp. enterica]